MGRAALWGAARACRAARRHAGLRCTHLLQREQSDAAVRPVSADWSAKHCQHIRSKNASFRLTAFRCLHARSGISLCAHFTCSEAGLCGALIEAPSFARRVKYPAVDLHDWGGDAYQSGTTALQLARYALPATPCYPQQRFLLA